ncbi:MAG: hypothetical protein ISP49_09185 [Reyranella sp.]|nr:hypothetical protein [Reyranella sp.]
MQPKIEADRRRPYDVVHSEIDRLGSVHLEPANSLDVVEGVGLMTKVALFHAGASLPGNPLIHHPKMHHEMGTRRLMALVAVL